MRQLHLTKGFTMIELLITVLIVAILVAIATYTYRPNAMKGRRIDGVNALLSISLAEERYRTNHTSYGTLAQVWSGVTTSTEGYYSLSISNVTSTSYTITATAQGTQANDTQNGTACSSLVLSLSNGTVTRTPAVCWPK